MHGQGMYTSTTSGEPVPGHWCLGERLEGMSEQQARAECKKKATAKPLTAGTTGQSIAPPVAQSNADKSNGSMPVIEDLQDNTDKKHSIPAMPANRPPNQAPPVSQPAQSAEAPSKGATAPYATMARGSNINEAKPPARPQRTGASMKTEETLKLASDKLFNWVNAGGERERDQAGQ